MNTKYILILILFVIINQVYSKVTQVPAYALWNIQDGAVIGLIQLPTAEAKALYTLKGYQHKQSNQFSTYNYETNIATFIVSNVFPNNLYLYQYDFNNNEIKLIQTFDTSTTNIHSLSSTQTNSNNDLIFSYSLNGHEVDLMGRYNNVTGKLTILDVIPGTFSSAVFSNNNQVYSVISIEDNLYKFSNYSSNGNLITSQTLTLTGSPSGVSSAPYQLSHIECLDYYLFMLDYNNVPNLMVIVGNEIYSINDPGAVIYTNLQAFAIAGDYPSHSNKDPKYYQFVSLQPSPLGLNQASNLFDYSGYLNTWSTNVLPVNMWCIEN